MEVKIGELAKQTDCTVETIRYYEKEGLLPAPMRSTGNFRLYGESHVERLQFVRHCRSLGMTLDEVKKLLQFRDRPAEDCAAINAMVDRHIAQVEVRVKELHLLTRHLVALRERCAIGSTAGSCGILRGLSERQCCNTTAQPVP